MWIDAHSHLADEHWADRLDDVVAKARATGVSGWVQGGVSPSQWERQLRLRDRFGSSIVLAFGLHPWWVASASDDAVDAALRELENRLPEAALLGELGLDFASRGGDAAAHARQRHAFNAQLSLAKQAGKPLALHIVRADAEALRILTAFAPSHHGLVHGFSGDAAAAQRYLTLGFDLSVGPGVAKPGFHRLKEALPALPEDRLLLETDDAAPHRLVDVAEAVAALRGGDARSHLDRSTRRVKSLLETPSP